MYLCKILAIRSYKISSLWKVFFTHHDVNWKLEMFAVCGCVCLVACHHTLFEEVYNFNVIYSATSGLYLLYLFPFPNGSPAVFDYERLTDLINISVDFKTAVFMGACFMDMYLRFLLIFRDFFLWNIWIISFKIIIYFKFNFCKNLLYLCGPLFLILRRQRIIILKTLYFEIFTIIAVRQKWNIAISVIFCICTSFF